MSTEYLPVPPAPWVATATDAVTHRLPDDTMQAIAESQEIADKIVEIAGEGTGEGVATPDATATVKGKLKLAGDLGGTADEPTVPGLADKADAEHGHVIEDVTGLEAALSGKASTSHTHDPADVTGFVVAVVEAIADALVEGSNVTVTYDDQDGTITISAAGGEGAPADATTESKGVVQLAGHLAGTASSPTVRSASESQTGVVELATAAETTTGTDDTRAVHPKGLKVELDKKLSTSDAPELIRDTIGAALTAGSNVTITPNDAGDTITIAVSLSDASTSAKGVVELATSAETQAGSDSTRAVTPAGLAATTATESRAGVVELATNTEAVTGSDTARAVTPAGLAAKLADSSVAEIIRDVVGATLVGGENVTVTVDDNGNEITIDAEGGAPAASYAQSVIVETGDEERPTGSDVVVWVDTDGLGAPNAEATDVVITAGGDSSKLDVSAAPELIRDTIATALVAGSGISISHNDGADTITIAATGGGGGGGDEVVPRWPGGMLGPSYSRAENGPDSALSAGYLHCVPFKLTAPLDAVAMAVNVHTAGESGTVVRLGIYELDSEAKPDALVIDAGTVAADSTGLKTASFTKTTIPAGNYVLCAVSNDTCRISARGGVYFDLAWWGLWSDDWPNQSPYTWIEASGYDATDPLPETATGTFSRKDVNDASPLAIGVRYE